jgi:bifunctional non-homologous end joining protein LigD
MNLMEKTSNTFAIARSEACVFPTTLKPMLLQSEKEPFNREGWIFEPKLDGMRAIVLVDRGSCKILSKTGRSLNATFPELLTVLSEHKDQLVLDGEIVALTPDGRPDFEALQSRWLLTKEREVRKVVSAVPVALYVFDLLYFNGHSLTKCKLTDRKMLLSERLQASSRLPPDSRWQQV